MKVKPEEIQTINFGVTMRINEAKMPTIEFNGVYPSPAFPDFESIVTKIVDDLNKVLGTKLAAIRVYSLDELEEVAPGEYQLKESVKNGEQAKRVAVEAD